MIRFLMLLILLDCEQLLAQDLSRSVMVLENKASRLTIDLGGGALSDFHLKGNIATNPLEWDSAKSDLESDTSPLAMEPRAMGHFLCLDRWGSVSEAERANGMGKHGEASQVLWHIVSAPKKSGNVTKALMRTDLPLAGLTVERDISMLDEVGLIRVRETVTNMNPIGRIYNLVQHPSISGSFLDEATRIDCNGTLGFAQWSRSSHPWEHPFHWPYAADANGQRVDIRYLREKSEPAVASYLVEDPYGWITAVSPSSGLLLGYLWNSEALPWIHHWRKVSDGRPAVRGLEFGTTGLHQPGEKLVEQGKIFDRKLFHYIDAGEAQSFSYLCFLIRIPQGFEGVASVTYADEKIIITESGVMKREISLKSLDL